MGRKRVKLKLIKSAKTPEWTPDQGISMRHFLISQKDGITALYAARKSLERILRDPETTAEHCGVSENCLICQQLPWCVTSEAEKELLGLRYE